jgi:hypothetical protein
MPSPNVKQLRKIGRNPFKLWKVANMFDKISIVHTITIVVIFKRNAVGKPLHW